MQQLDLRQIHRYDDDETLYNNMQVVLIVVKELENAYTPDLPYTPEEQHHHNIY